MNKFLSLCCNNVADFSYLFNDMQKSFFVTKYVMFWNVHKNNFLIFLFNKVMIPSFWDFNEIFRQVFILPNELHIFSFIKKKSEKTL